MLAQCYAQMEDWHSAYITAKDAFEKCKVTVENEQIFERLSATLRRVIRFMWRVKHEYIENEIWKKVVPELEEVDRVFNSI